jgi:hypothetical protein
MIMHAYNPRYSGSESRNIMVQGQPRQKVARPCLKNKPAWWCTAAISATQEVEVRGSRYMASLSKAQDLLPYQNILLF